MEVLNQTLKTLILSQGSLSHCLMEAHRGECPAGAQSYRREAARQVRAVHLLRCGFVLRGKEVLSGEETDAKLLAQVA